MTHQVLEARQYVTRPQHPHTLVSMNNLIIWLAKL